MAVVDVAPCQCFSFGGIHTTSPGRIDSTGPPQRCTKPLPAVTIKVWPNGWVCHAVRAPGSKVTLAPATRAGSGACISGSTRTLPVKYSAGPLPDGREPLRLMSIVPFLALAGAAGVVPAANTARPVVASRRLRVNMVALRDTRPRSPHVRHLLQQLVERDRIIADAHAGRIIDRVGDGCRD